MPRYLWTPRSKKPGDNRDARCLLINNRAHEPGSIVELPEHIAAPHVARGDMRLEGEEPRRRGRPEAPPAPPPEMPARVMPPVVPHEGEFPVESEPSDPEDALPVVAARPRRAVPKPSAPHLSDELPDDEARAVAVALGQPKRLLTTAKARDFLRSVDHNRLTAAIAELRAGG